MVNPAFIRFQSYQTHWGFSMKLALAAAATLALSAVPTQAAVSVTWVDWTEADADTVVGTLGEGGATATFNSPQGFGFVQTNGGTNYWTEDSPAPYTGGTGPNAPSNAPGTPDIIALSTGGTKTITFSQAISGLYLALVSWNGNGATFDQDFEIVSQGDGYWGSGGLFEKVPGSTPGSYTLLGVSGEPHGVIYFPGTFTSLTFTDNTNEFWHGVTIGIGAFAQPVPEPATWGMMIAGFGAAGVAMRRRRRKTLAVA